MNARGETYVMGAGGRRRPWATAVVVALAIVGARAAEVGTVPEGAVLKDPLATKQQIVRDRMTQLEDRLFRLTEKLTTAEPQQAERLANALRRTRELLIRRSMDETISLLDERQLAEAADRQLAIIKNLEEVLKILLEESGNTERRQKEIDKLQAYRDEIKALLDEQQALKAQTDGVPMPATAPASSAPASKPAEGQEKGAGKPLDPAKAAGQQRDLQQRTQQLGSQMESNVPPGGSQSSQPSEKGGGNKPGQPGGGKKDGQQGGGQKDGKQPPPEPAPGTPNVQKAGQHMGDAAEDLDEKKAADASQDQAKAIDQLQQAMDELQRTLDQLRREQQEEILRGLEARFRAMLAQQLVINDGTKKLEAKGKPAWTHEDELLLAGFSHDEQGLGDQAGEALRILQEEGTTIVFPQIVEQLREDMNEVTRRLGGSETGDETQRTEAVIVETLEELIEAVKQLRDQISGGGGGGGGGGKNPPLLPPSAELKLLRSCQQRVNRQTIEYHGVSEAAKPVTPELQAKLGRLAERQRELAEMAKKMNERVTGQ